MMPTVLVCYPGNPRCAAEVDAAWLAEAEALREQGIAVAAINMETLQLESAQPVAADAQVLWRGGTWDAAGYARLEAALAGQGHRLLTSTQDYLRAQYLPGWLATLVDHTAQTRVVPLSHLEKLPAITKKLDWWPLFVKDYVQSAKAAASLAHSPEEVSCLVEQLIARRGAVEGGICLRKAETYLAGSEHRFIVWHQNVWPHPSAPEPAVALARLVTRHFWHPYYTVDVGQREDGRWRVVEIGDGQVSALKEWPLTTFAAFLRPSLQPHLA